MDEKSRGRANPPPRILEYRKQVKISSTWYKYFSYALFCLFFIDLGFQVFLLKFAKGKINGIDPALEVAFFGFFIFMTNYFFYWPMAISKIQVFEDRILITRGKKEIIIPFLNIASLEFPKNKSMTGWFKIILKDKNTYRFSILLERVDYILDAIYRFNSNLLEENEFKKNRTNLILSEHNVSRLYDLFSHRYRLITISHLAFLPLLFFTVLYLKQREDFIINNLINYFFSLFKFTFFYLMILWSIFLIIINRINDKNMLKQLGDNINNKVRDTDYEHNIYKKIFPIYLSLLFLFFFGVTKTNINTLDKVEISRDSKEFKLRRDESLWVDTRFNCTDCKYHLILNDLVSTSYGVGKIVGLPGDRVIVKVQSPNQDRKEIKRTIASVEDVSVPQNNIAIKLFNGESILINNNKIKGKIFREIPHFK